MKFIINYSPPGSTSKVYKTELTSSNPKETWGQLTQRFIEHSSLHPPQLLSLLKSLNHGSAKNKYQLRYGNGYATNCNITWNASSRGSAGGGEDDEMIEANITLKPLAGSPLANTSLGKVSDISMLVIADSVPTKVKSAALEISIELVGLPNPNSAIKMTQAPFPIDMEKVNVLDIVEHGRFEGVVDQYSLKKFNESGQVGGVAATPMSSGKKRKESSAGASATTSTTAKKASAATAATSSTKKKEKKKDKTSATTSSKKQKTAKDNTNDGKDGTAETTPKKSSSAAAAAEETTEKKKSKKKKKKKSSDVEEDNKAGPTGTVKKSRKSSDGKGEEDEANPVDESSPPKSSKKEKKKKKKSKESNEDKDDEEETSPSKAKLPKRPVNAYMLYGNAVRQQVKDANPELKPTEVMKMIAEMYRGLSPEELQKYKDMATANMTKFKEEYGEDALKQSTKKKKKKKKEEDDEDVATEVAKVSTKKDEAEESDDESESEDDGEAIPKPPVSAYMDYSSFIRPKIKEENPNATPTEMMTLIGAAYKALDEGTLQKFKDKATKNMAEYKAKYGEDAVAKSRRQAKKDKEKKKKDREKKKRKSSAAIGAGDEGGAESPKKKKQKSSDTGAAAAASPKKSVTYDQPAVPAEGLPAGWTTRSITRKTGNHVDKYFFSPTEEYKFVSKPKVLQFLECMVSADNNEVAAMKLYKEKEKKKKGTAASPKKSKSVEAETVVVTKKHTDSDSDDSSSDGSVPEEADAEAKVVKEADNSDSDSQSSEGSAPAAWAA